jgi:hypothetical protein
MSFLSRRRSAHVIGKLDQAIGCADDMRSVN